MLEIEITGDITEIMLEITGDITKIMLDIEMTGET